VATRCHVLKIKCIEFDSGWSFDPHPTREAYSAPEIPSLDRRDLLLREERRAEEKGREDM